MSTISRLEWVAVIAVLVLAAGLRLGYPGVNPFAADEARVSVLALQMARGEQFITQGIASSAGTANLPASVYVFVPPYRLTADPLAATQYVGVLNVLAVIGLWWLVRRTFGAQSAFVAALFLASAPYAVFFSRNIWTQNLLVPFAVGWLISAHLALTTSHGRTRRLSIAGAVVLAGVAFQVHLAGLALVLGTLYAFLRGRWWRHLGACVVGAGLAALPLLPFVYRAVCCAPELVSAYVQSSGDNTLDAQAIALMGKLALNRGWDYLAAGDLAAHGSWALPQLLSGVLVGLGMMGIVRRVWAHRPRPESQAHEETGARACPPRRSGEATEAWRLTLIELTLILLIAPIVLFTYQRAPVRLHYLLTALPALALMVGLSVLLPWHKGKGIAALMLFLAVLWSGQILHSLALANAQVAPNGINTPLKVRRDVAYSLPPDGVAVMHTQTEDYRNRGEPAIWKVLFWDRPHRVANGWATLILPPEPAHLMYEIDHYDAWHEIHHNGLMDERLIRYDPLPGAQEHYNQPYDGATVPANYTRLASPVMFDNGLQLLGWEARQAGGLLRVAVLYEAWRDPTPHVTLQQFTHLRIAENREAAQPDLTADSPLTDAWRAGDRIVALASARPDVETATFHITVGQYLLETGQRLTTEDGRDSIELGAVGWVRP